MQNPVKIPATILHKLKEIDKMHGAMSPFLKKASINYKTFKRLLKEDFAQAAVIYRVEEALAEKRGTPADVMQHVEKCLVIHISDVEGKRVKDAEERKQNSAYIKLLNTKLRALCVYALWKKTRLDNHKIAALVGYKHWTGVIKAIECVDENIERNKQFQRFVFNTIGSI